MERACTLASFANRCGIKSHAATTTIFSGRLRLVTPANGASPSGRMHRSFPEPYLLFHVESRATPRFDRSSPSSVRLRIRLVEHELAPPQKKFPGQGKRGQEKPASPASMQRIPGGGVRGVSDDSGSRVVQRFHLLTRKSSAGLIRAEAYPVIRRRIPRSDIRQESEDHRQADDSMIFFFRSVAVLDSAKHRIRETRFSL